MIAAKTFRDETVAVMGLARSGLASVRSLAAGGARVLAWDDNAERRDEAAVLGAEIVDLAQADFAAIEYLLLSPGIPHTHPAPHPVAERARARGVSIIGDVEILVRNCPEACLVGVTGTNGKSTTTALIGHILTEAGVACEVGGNIGRPVLEFAVPPSGGIQVLELSSYQLELAPSLSCDVAVLLNISPDHLDRHGGMVGYVAAKRRILDGMGEGGVAVIGVDDEESRQLREATAGRSAVTAIPVSGLSVPAGGVGVDNGHVVSEAGGSRHNVVDLAAARALPGSHNAQNAAAAAAVVQTLGIDVAAIGSALLSFPGLPHRQERIGERDGVTFVNDSKATNADAAARALGCYSTIYWIVGGLAKQGGIDALAPYFPSIRHAFLIGESMEQFACTLEGRVRYTACGTLDQALSKAAVMAWREARDGATVLLSPAAASFDQFASYETRGDRFRALAKASLDNDRDGRWSVS